MRIPSPIMFDCYNDNLGTFDYLINGVRKIGYSAYSNSGLAEFTKGKMRLKF
ncbi:MAG TPA: hypothetical protein VE860_09175 [Chthoniobacterales bacterium]|nr:hypothetical protein [Chthoniobacterales bacterium]